MNYPVAYAVIPEEEKTYIVGSGDVQYEKLFNYFIGDFLRDTVKSDVRNAIWNSAKRLLSLPLPTGSRTWTTWVSLHTWATSTASGTSGETLRATWAN